jgi:type 1 glutamine amidotransferase
MLTSPRSRAGIWLAMMVLGMVWQNARLLAQPNTRDENPSPKKVQRVLLLGQRPDGHPFSTHEYMAGVNIMAACLQKVPGVQAIVIQADDPWTDGPELLDGADAVVLFLSEGAKWMGSDAKRLAAFQRLAERKGGLVCLHWGLGCKEEKYIADFLALFGGCHGGPDRKHQVVTKTLALASPGHPVLQGINPVEVHEEFYYRLKFPKSEPKVTPLLHVPIDGETHTVAWAWDRPDGGRSCGFSGGHFHDNWHKPEYRRLLAQSILWALRLPIPEGGLDVTLDDKTLKLAPRDVESPP